MPMLRMASPRSSAFVERLCWPSSCRASELLIWLSTNSARFLTSVLCGPASTFLMMGSARSPGCAIRPSSAANASSSSPVGSRSSSRVSGGVIGTLAGAAGGLTIAGGVCATAVPCNASAAIRMNNVWFMVSSSQNVVRAFALAQPRLHDAQFEAELGNVGRGGLAATFGQVLENRIEGAQHACQLRLTGPLRSQRVHLVLPDDGVDQARAFFR